MTYTGRPSCPHQCQTMSQAGPLGLINASMNGDLKKVQALLAAGADKEAKNEVGWVGGWAGVGHTMEESWVGLVCMRVMRILMPSMCHADWKDTPHPGRRKGPRRGGASPVGSGRQQGGQAVHGGWWGSLGGRGTAGGCVHHEIDEDENVAFIVHRVTRLAVLPSLWPARTANSRWCRPCWLRAPTRRPGSTWWGAGSLGGGGRCS